VSPDASRSPERTTDASSTPASVKEPHDVTADVYAAGTLDRWLAARDRVTGAGHR